MQNDRSAAAKGALFVFLSAVFFSIGGLFMKLIPWNGLAINSARNVFSVLVLAAFFRIRRHKLVINRTVLIGALAIVGTNILYSLANKLTTAGNTIILQFTAPIWVMVFSSLLLKKKPGRLDLIAAAIVFAGVICFFIDSLSSGHLAGDLLALLSGIFYAGVFMMNAREDSDSLSSVLIGMVLNVLTGLPFLIREQPFSAGMDVWTPVLVLGIFQLGLAYVFLTEGLAITPPVTASLISGIEPVLNPLLVAVFYGEMLTPLSLVGAAIVFLSVIGYNLIRLKQAEAGT